MWWINKQGGLYAGECAAGDRAATTEEVAAWRAARQPDYRDLRRAAYPPRVEFDTTQQWMDACDAVNALYPKPS